MPMLRTISCVEGRSQSVAKAAACPGFSLMFNRSLMSPGKHEEYTVASNLHTPAVLPLYETVFSKMIKRTPNQLINSILQVPY